MFERKLGESSTKLTKHINMLADDLMRGLGPGVVLVLDLHGIGWSGKEGNVNIEVVGFLDRSHNLEGFPWVSRVWLRHVGHPMGRA